METRQKSQNYEKVVEKIVFDEDELEELKITIRTFTEGKIGAKQLKQILLQSRGRMVKDISHFLRFCIDRIRNDDLTSDDKKNVIGNQVNQIEIQLQQELKERNELLELVAKRVKNILVKNK